MANLIRAVGFPGTGLKKKKNLPAMQGPRFNPWVGKIPWMRSWQPTPIFLPGESLQTGAWRTTVLGFKESDTTEVT